MDAQPEFVASGADLATPQGVYDAVRFVVGFCDCPPAVVTGLTWILCDYLRDAPADMRGQATARVTEIISNDVRRSLQ
jgi:hypothetical protein